MTDINPVRLASIIERKNRKDKALFFTVSNSFIFAHFELGLIEQKFLRYAIAIAREKCCGFDVDNPLLIKVSDFAYFFGIGFDSAYSQLISAASSMINQRLYLVDREKYGAVNFFQRIYYIRGSGAIEIVFSQDMAKLCTRLEFGFTRVRLEDFKNFKNKHEIRIYEMCVCLARLAGAGKKGHRKFRVEEIKNLIGIDADSYPDVCDFNRMVISPAIKNINIKSNITVELRQEKLGRKIYGYTIFCSE